MGMIDSALLSRFFRLDADTLEDARQYLCALDGEVGDGDHGTSMANGFSAITARLRVVAEDGLPPDALLREAAQAFLGEVGATVGPLYASAMLTAAKRFAETPPENRDLAMLLGGLVDGISQCGKAGVGDKTMLDAWYPAVQAARAAVSKSADFAVIAMAAANAAQKGADATASMIASRGRAARLKERSLGHVYPGAASAAILIGSFADLARSGS